MLNFKSTILSALSYDLPPEFWTSTHIEEELSPLYNRLNLPQGRLELMTGIRERRFYSRDTLPSQAATRAARNLFNQYDIDKNSIDLLIHCAVCRDGLEPATAAYVHHNLGLPPSTTFFDISNACLGFLNSLIVAGSMIESGMIKRALIVAGENGRTLIENTIHTLNNNLALTRQSIKPYFANLTVGAGAIAAILSHESLTDTPPLWKPSYAVSLTDSSSSNLCQGDGNISHDHKIHTDSGALLLAGSQLALKTWTQFSKETSWTADTPDRIICHQVGKQHRTKIYETLGFDLNKDSSTFETLGNIGSVALPITYAKYLEQNLQPNNLLLMGIGSGLSTIIIK